MVLILGAGIAGISAGYHCKQAGIDCVIYEKNIEWGGLTGNFVIDGFRFDHAIHLSFTDNEYVKKLFSEATDYITHTPKSENYYEGVWAKHPVQNNLYPFSVETKVSVIQGFIENKEVQHNINNYEDWLKAQYGEYFAENFPMKYTRKYWCCDADELSTSWVGSRMYQPSLEEVLHGAMTEETPNTYYAKEMRYPEKGGYKSFLKKMVIDLNIKTDSEVTFIDTKRKEVVFKSGQTQSYDQLISTLPLPVYKNLLPNIPQEIKDAIERLQNTSVALVSIGLNNDHKQYPRKDVLWFYIYDEDILPARVYSPVKKSADNAPAGTYSYQFEIYFNPKKNQFNLDTIDLVQHVIDSSVRMDLFSAEDVLVKDLKVVDYANVVFYLGMEQDRELIKEFLNSQGIITAGRFGEWDYLWSDQSLISGMNAVSNLMDKKET